MKHKQAIANSHALISNNPWLLDNDKEELSYILEDGDLPYFDPSGVFGPSYSSHLGSGNECCMKTLKEIYEAV